MAIRQLGKLRGHKLRYVLFIGVYVLWQDPFALYPGESLVGAEDFSTTKTYKNALLELPAVKQDHAIQVSAFLPVLCVELLEQNTALTLYPHLCFL